MSLQSRMESKKQDASLRESVRKQLYKNEKSFRAGQAIEAWSKIPIIGAGLKNLPLKERENVALNLNAQAGYMSRLSEAQLSTQFQNFAPQNMLRLVRLTMPQVCRSKCFTEFYIKTHKLFNFWEVLSDKDNQKRSIFNKKRIKKKILGFIFSPRFFYFINLLLNKYNQLIYNQFYQLQFQVYHNNKHHQSFLEYFLKTYLLH